MESVATRQEDAHAAPVAPVRDQTDATPECPGLARAAEAPAATPGAAEAPATGGGWRADIATFVAGATSVPRGRAASAAGVAVRAATLGLAGPLGAELADKWRDGDPSSPAARNLQALRTAARARVME
eukprot:3360152-Pleurochrysis_carterae.AAC.1